jgi:hypothetical protein
VEADLVADGRQQPPGEELNSLGFLQWPGARQERLEAILVLLNRVGAPTLGELEQRR